MFILQNKTRIVSPIELIINMFVVNNSRKWLSHPLQRTDPKAFKNPF